MARSADGTADYNLEESAAAREGKIVEDLYWFWGSLSHG
jgi:hypothetical protein